MDAGRRGQRNFPRQPGRRPGGSRLCRPRNAAQFVVGQFCPLLVMGGDVLGAGVTGSGENPSNAGGVAGQ